MTPDEKMKIEEMRASAMTRQGDIEDKEDEMYAGASPKGSFSGKSLNALVEATNRLLPLFGISEPYDKFGNEKLNALPPEFVRVLTMFSKAIDDAVAEGILPEDATIDMSIITDDNGLQTLAGRVGMAAKNSGFKRFLLRKTEKSAPMEEEMDMEKEMSEDEMSEDKTEDLFASRM